MQLIPQRWQRGGPTWAYLMMASGLALAQSVGCSGKAHQEPPHQELSNTFEPVYRAGKAVEAAVQVGVAPSRYQELLQAFSTELSIVDDKVSTDDQRALSSLFRAALTAYKDAGTFRELRPKKGNIYARETVFANPKQDKDDSSAHYPPLPELKRIVEAYHLRVDSTTDHYRNGVTPKGWPDPYTGPEKTVTQLTLPDDSLQSVWKIAGEQLDAAVATYNRK